MTCFTVEQNDALSGKVIKTWSITMDNFATVLDLKRILAGFMYSGLTVEQQLLTHDGLLMFRDFYTIGQYQISDGSKVRLRLKSGWLGARVPVEVEEKVKTFFRYDKMDYRGFKAVPEKIWADHRYRIHEASVVNILLKERLLEHVNQWKGRRYVRDTIRGGIESCVPDITRDDDDQEDEGAVRQAEIFDSDNSEWALWLPDRSAVDSRILAMYAHWVTPNEMGLILDKRMGLFCENKKTINQKIAEVLIREGRVAIFNDATEQNDGAVWLQNVWPFMPNRLFDPLFILRPIGPQMEDICNREELLIRAHAYTAPTPTNDLEAEVEDLFLSGIMPDRIPGRLSVTLQRPSIAHVIDILEELQLVKVQGPDRVVRLRSFGRVWEYVLPPLSPADHERRRRIAANRLSRRNPVRDGTKSVVRGGTKRTGRVGPY